jgi:hypothetical protein
MTSTAWGYLVPYQENIGQALTEIQQDIFQRGEFFTELGDLLAFIRSEQTQHISQEKIEQIKARINQLEQEPIPVTIPALIQKNGDAGTHSIIDMQGISDKPKEHHISPLTEDEIIKYFGHKQPTLSMLEQNDNNILSLCEHWQGRYLLVYENEKPIDIFLVGISGE